MPQAHLKRLKYVKSFHLGEYGEGDAGVTIAEFKDWFQTKVISVRQILSHAQSTAEAIPFRLIYKQNNN